ncbi:hypothetical protein CEG14_05750 [Bordetella genomosp. 1]|uniref:Uncharacterized protein n=1 Tax=Bordetella genomosp. 1 TaxID=1395607 RepID=A0A261SNS2_9BORD|nr:hypothetical protein [Bordetella genomosp. 1]OZI39039.1 hypothetical protein CEG14_05750 [Bordetella genomosp. 1]
MTFVKRRIDVTINLAEGEFGDDLGAAVTLQGYRVQAAVIAYNGDAQSQLQLRIFGLSQDMINKLTVIGPVLTERRNNRILVAAGDVGESALTVVYEGTIAQAWADYNQAPEVAFNVVALAAAFEAVRPTNARSYRGAVQAESVAADIARAMGVAFQNNGVSVTLSNPYFPGTAFEQLKSCARAGRFNFSVDRGVLAIWPYAGARASEPILIEAGRNLVGYPTFTGGGVEFSLLYTPQLGLGDLVQVISVVEAAHGEWIVVSLVHQLESEVPGGGWISRILCQRSING